MCSVMIMRLNVHSVTFRCAISCTKCSVQRRDKKSTGLSAEFKFTDMFIFLFSLKVVLVDIKLCYTPLVFSILGGLPYDQSFATSCDDLGYAH